MNSNVVLVIPKGTKIITINNNHLERGYGFIGYPTYKKGWRYSRTFIVDENDKSIEELPYYYVRTKDLEDIADKVYDANKSFKISSQQMKLSRNQFINKMVRVIDTTLYDKGVYNSPDLYKDIIGITEVILLVTCILLLAICIHSKRHSKTK